MNKQVSSWIWKIVGHLNRSGCTPAETFKAAQHFCRVGGEVEDYLTDIKKIFVEKFRQDPSLEKIDPVVVWRSMENTMRKDVEKLLGRRAAIATANEKRPNTQ